MQFFRAVMGEDFMAWLDGRLQSLQPALSQLQLRNPTLSDDSKLGT